MTTAPPMQMPQTKGMYAYRVVRDAILRCEYRPGQRLVADAIARQLSLSVIPVREALQLLQAEGLVRNVAHAGMVVSPISRDSIVETFTVLEGLELVATRVAAARMTVEDGVALRAIVREMDDALRNGAHDRWGDLNRRFHQSVADIAAMPMLRDMTGRALNQWDRVRRYYFERVLVHRIVRSQQEHHAILAAMARRDDGEIARLVKIHNGGALVAYTAHLDESLETQEED